MVVGHGGMIGREFHPVADIFPLMQGREFDDLVADIGAHGLCEPIWLHQDGRIIDGRNRYRACRRGGQEPRFQTYIGPDDNLANFVISMNLHRRHLNESQRAMVGARIASMKRGARTDLAPIGGMSQPEAADTLNVGTRSLQRAKAVLDGGAEELIRAVDGGTVMVSDAAIVAGESHSAQRALLGMVTDGKAKNLKAARVKRDIERQRLDIAEGRADLPEGVFEVIVIDPPWPYDTKYDPTHRLGRSACRYPDMSIDELEALEPPAAKNCVLWLWTTNAFMGEACDLLKAWGFQPKTILTWVKPRLGTGHWLRNCTEHCLLAVKGSPWVSLTNQTTLLEAPARGHSRKPDEFYDLVDSLCVGRKLDYFSREARPGWTQFGNEPSMYSNDERIAEPTGKRRRP